LKLFASFCLSSLLLTSCATITPDKVSDNTESFDSTTPVNYDNLNSGIIGFTEDSSGILTPFGVERYNNLIEQYKIRFKEYKGVDLKKNDGISNYVDKHGNVLFKIDAQHFVYFGVLNSWRKDGVESDSLWDKAKNLVK
jgi:hypothetical protein